MKKLLITLFLISPFSFAEDTNCAEEVYQAGLISDQKDGESYEGYTLNGFRNGKGTLMLEGGNRVITGIWTRGFLFEGKIETFKNGALESSYEGEIKNYKANGIGKKSWGNSTEWAGHTYVGAFRDGKRNGDGIYTWPHGEVYNGRWENNNREGYGFVKYANGNAYYGYHENGKRSGAGQFNYANGDVYIGRFEEGKLDNLGVMYKKNGNHYAGWFKNGKHIKNLTKNKKSNNRPTKPKASKLNGAYLTGQDSIVGGSMCYYSDGTSTRISANYCPRRN